MCVLKRHNIVFQVTFPCLAVPDFIGTSVVGTFYDW